MGNKNGIRCHVGRNFNGRYSAYPDYNSELGITKFQDFLYKINDRTERQRTDEELSGELHEEHPEGVIIHADHREKRSVRSVRRAYNIGTQGHGPANAPSVPYWLENGRRVRRPYPDPYVT